MRANQNPDLRSYNISFSSEIGVKLPVENNTQVSSRSIVLYKTGSGNRRINSLNP